MAINQKSKKEKKNNGKIYIVVPKLRSLHNVGSIFRTGDAIDVSKIFLCGWTGTPPAPNLIKVSLGAEDSIPWEKHKQAWRVIDNLKKQGVQIIGLEYTKGSVDYRDFKPNLPCALVIGHEVNGLSDAILKRCDAIIHLPMLGIKKSLNVSIATGIAMYSLRFGK